MRNFKFAFLGFALVLLAACAGQRALYKQAHTPPQYAKAVLLHANAIGKEVAALRANPSVSEASKTALLKGYREMVCSQEELTANAATAACENGPTWQLDRAGRAYEQAANVQTQADVDAAVASIQPLIIKIIDLIAGALS